jgi:hypothetical protein
MNPESRWTVYRTRFLVRAHQLTEPFVFTDALGREQSGRPGDYLVESSDGIRRITTQAIFEDIYVPLASPSLRSPTPRVQIEVQIGVPEEVPTVGPPAILPRHPVTGDAPEHRSRATAYG